MERRGSSSSYLLDLLFVLAEKAKTEADIEKLNKLNLTQFNLSFSASIWAQLHLEEQGGQEEDLSIPDQGRTGMSCDPSAKDPVKGAEGSW